MINFSSDIFSLNQLTKVFKKFLETVEIPDDASNVEIAKALQPLNEKYGMDKGDTFSTNAHWAWVNGLASRLDVSYIA